MPELLNHIAPAIRGQWMSEDDVFDAYIDYEARFGKLHAILACHAAFPLLVDPHLVNLIRINFLGDEEVPWMAEPDFLLSPFCRPYENGFFHVDPTAREVLLDVLKNNLPNGRRRLNELADFMLAYIEDKEILAPKSSIIRTHRWVAWSYLYPERLADELARQLEAPLATGRRGSLQHIEIATMMEISRGPLSAGLPAETFNELADVAGVLARYYYRSRKSVTVRSVQEGSLAERVVRKLRLSSPEASGGIEQGGAQLEGAPSTETLRPPKPNPNFVDREQETQNLANILMEPASGFIEPNAPNLYASKTVVALTGPVGMGKRSLALHIAHQPVVQEYFHDGVLWVEGTEVDSFLEVTRHIADHFDLQLGDNAVLEQLIEGIAPLIYERNCLLILANLDDLIYRNAYDWSYFQEILKRMKERADESNYRWQRVVQSRVLFTARAADMAFLDGPLEAELFSLSPLSEEAAAEMLATLRPSIAESPRLPDLAEVIDRAPAAIEQVAELLEEHDDDVDEVLERVKNLGLERLVQRLLDRIESPEIRELVPWALLLRRVSPGILRGVLVGEGVATESPSKADLKILLDQLLEAELIEPTGIEGLFQVRRDVRHAMLVQLTRDDPSSVEQLHLAAVTYYLGKRGAENRAEEIYHRLWSDDSFDEIDARWMKGVELLLIDAVGELPIPAKGYLAERLGVELSDADREDMELYEVSQIENPWHTVQTGEPNEDILKRADQHFVLKELVQAQGLYKNVLAAVNREESLSRDDIEHKRRALTGLAKTEEDFGNIDEAAKYFRVALNYIEKETDPDEPAVEISRQELALFYARHGQGNPFERAPARLAFEPEMIQIPAGIFLMGSTKEDRYVREDEFPQHRVELSAYAIGKYPVTNKEYRYFVKEASHRSPKHWKGHEYPKDKADHPVVYVSWDDAMAYCEWLNEKTGKHYSLPTEAQWEKAARGDDGRIYPWGDERDPDRLNAENNIEDPTPVGQYSPAGDSPYGCADMAGNVLEWCLDGYDEAAYEGREGVTIQAYVHYENQKFRVLRGGSFLNSQGDCRSAARHWSSPYLQYYDVGFRIVLLPSNPMDDEPDGR